MKITFPVYNFNQYNNKPSTNYASYPKVRNCDTVSFTSQKSDYMERLDKLEQNFRKRVPGVDLCLLKNMYLNEETLPAVEEIINIPNFPKKYLFHLLITNKNNENYHTDIVETAHYYTDIYHQLHKNHEHFLGLYTPNHRNEIDYVFNSGLIVRLVSLHDKDLNSILIDKKSDKFRHYTKMLGELHMVPLDIFRDALKCKSTEGKPLNPNDKLQLLELLDAYRLVHAGFYELKKMTENGVIDIKKLRENLVFEVMKSCGYSTSEILEIPQDKLELWDKNYIHLLVRPAKKYSSEFSDIIKLANGDTDFKIAIHDKSENYGVINNHTKREFKNYGLDYEKWLNPSVDNNVILQLTNQSSDKLKDASSDYIKNIAELLQFTPVNNFIHKKYPQYMTDGEFNLPTEITSNKRELVKFMNNFIKELKPVWSRSQGNSESENEHVRILAKHILTLKDHLETIAKTTETLPSSKEFHDIDLTIKMWDRIPQKDLFQGNYSTCCIAMGSANSQAMPAYLMNTAFNMIELLDNTTGKPVGNALCYYALNGDMNPIFVIDNIEINNGYKPDDNACMKIRDAIKEYVENINRDICPNQDIPIYMGGLYNDVPCEDLETQEGEFVTVLGKVLPDEVYLDSFKGWILPEIETINRCPRRVIRNNIDLKKL